MLDKSQLPRFDSPPVVETALSVQFAPLSGFTNAHAGWFWKNHLPPEWSRVVPAVRINDVFESFGENRKWKLPDELSISNAPTPDRLQIIRNDNNQDRMIQIQDTRVVYNWRRRSEQSYPSYDALLPKFRDSLERFAKFAVSADFGNLNFNQWEVIYVNHVPKGELWSSISDWPSILPCLSPPQATGAQRLDSLKCEWQFVIGNNLGRLYVSVVHARLLEPSENPEVIEIKLIARGPLDSETGTDLYHGLEIGHAAIVNTFAMITSNKAHLHWKRKI